MAVLRRASNVAHTAKSSRKLIDALSSLPSALDPRIQGILPVCDSRGSTQAPSILSRAEPSLLATAHAREMRPARKHCC